MSTNTLDSSVAAMQAEFIKKLHSVGGNLEYISAMTGVADNPQLIKAMLTQAHLRSLKYRCSHSARLMRSPVQGSRGKWWHRSRMEPPSGQHCTSLDEEVKATAY
jgi:hypothetical protein